MARVLNRAPRWCIVVQRTMAKKPHASDQGQPTRQPRASITFPPEVYETLEQIAKEKKVSLAWVVREAVEKYIADKWPLFGGRERE